MASFNATLFRFTNCPRDGMGIVASNMKNLDNQYNFLITKCFQWQHSRLCEERVLKAIKVLDDLKALRPHLRLLRPHLRRMSACARSAGVHAAGRDAALRPFAGRMLAVATV
jgi:hypothetical protein